MDEARFIQKVKEKVNYHHEETINGHKKIIKGNEKRIDELNNLVKKLYEAFATGKISDKHFERLLIEYDREQQELEKTVEKLQNEIDSYKNDNLKVDKFITLVKKYTDFTELTTPMLNEFIEKIVVHETEIFEDERKQKIEIYFNFIGAFDIPADIITPEEIEEEKRLIEEKEAKEKRRKELARARYERRKREKREFTERKKAGLLTFEEIEQDKRRREKANENLRQWRQKKALEMEMKKQNIV